jgi:hypothetical protein
MWLILIEFVGDLSAFMPLCKVFLRSQFVHGMEKPQIRPICNMDMQVDNFLTSLSIDSPGIIRSPIGEIFLSTHNRCVSQTPGLQTPNNNNNNNNKTSR